MDLEENKALKLILVILILSLLVISLQYKEYTPFYSKPLNLQLTQFDSQIYRGQKTCFTIKAETPEKKANYTLRVNEERRFKKQIKIEGTERIETCVNTSIGENTITAEIMYPKVRFKTTKLNETPPELNEEPTLRVNSSREDDTVNISLKSSFPKKKIYFLEAGDYSRYIKIGGNETKKILLQELKDVEKAEVDNQKINLPSSKTGRGHRPGLTAVGIILFFLPGLILFYRGTINSIAKSMAFSFLAFYLLTLILGFLYALTFRMIILCWIGVNVGCLIWRKR